MRIDALCAAVIATALGCAPPPPAKVVGVSTGTVREAPAPEPEVEMPPDPPLPSVEPPAPTPTEPAKPTPPLKPAAPKPAVASDARIRGVLAGGGAALQKVLAAPETYRFEVVLGEIVTKNGTPALERSTFRGDAEYFFPASSMKMPIALATYDRFAALRAAGRTQLTRDATLSVASGAEAVVTTLAYETRRALIVSDNASANRLVALVGHREVHETLWGLGLASARVRTGFATGAEIDPVEASPAVDVVVNGQRIPVLPARKSTLTLPPTDARALDIGDARIEGGRKLAGPMSFADKNAMKLAELQDTLVRIMRPELAPKSKAKVSLGADDLEYLRTTLGTLPSESGLPGYARNLVADYQLSPFLRGIERVRARGRFQIFSKVGQAYGFLVHNAYVVDKETGRAFFLAAAVYANPEGVMNSDNYAYDTIAFPALADVGEVFARHVFAAM